jgi:uncharacterized membrane protein
MIDVKRHILKTISYRIISSSIGFLTMWYLSGDVRIGAAFSLGELILKPIMYFLHERVWYKYIKYGVKNLEK